MKTRNRPDARRGDGVRPAKRHRTGSPVRGEKPDSPKSGERRPEKKAKPEGPPALWIYGRHAALAALANPDRQIKRILASESALGWLQTAPLPRERLATLAQGSAEDFERALHDGAVHQGLAVEVAALPRLSLEEACAPDGARPVVVLDQITDPHNIGAIFRSAAAFGARAIIVQDRRTPPLVGALAKAAAGAVEATPCVEVVNIARALSALKDLGYFCAGLSGDAEAPVRDMPRGGPVALALGAEGDGLRRLVSATCDGLYAIPIERRMESLNVSNAAAVTLYELART